MADRRTSTRLTSSPAGDPGGDGVLCGIDEYHEGGPPEGWTSWMERHLAADDYILIACTSTYLRRWMRQEAPGIGLGADWKAATIRVLLYRDGRMNTRFVPIVFDPADESSIPVPRGDLTSYRLYRPDLEGYIKLLRHLTRQPRVIAPPLGPRRHLPPERPEVLTDGQPGVIYRGADALAIEVSVPTLTAISWDGRRGDPVPVLCATLRNQGSRSLYVDRLVWRLAVDGRDRSVQLVNDPADVMLRAKNPPPNQEIAPGQKVEYHYRLQDLLCELARTSARAALADLDVHDQRGNHYSVDATPEVKQQFA